jgi:hypothetical protein
MSDEWGICDLLGMPHKKDQVTAGYVQPCVNWRPLVPAPKPEDAEGRVLTTEELQGEREVYRAVKHFGQSTGNAQYVRASLIDDLFQTLTAKDAEIARLTQERDAAVAATYRQAANHQLHHVFSVSDGKIVQSRCGCGQEFSPGACCAEWSAHIESLARGSTVLELERVRAAIGEAKWWDEYVTDESKPLAAVIPVLEGRVAELQRREKELSAKCAGETS